MARNRKVVVATKVARLVCAKCGVGFERAEANLKASQRRGITKTFCSNACASTHTIPTGTATRHAKGMYAASRSYSRGNNGWVVLGGREFFARSSWEANYGRFLQFQKTHGLIREWDHEPDTFWFKKIKRGVCSYLPDFKVTTNSGEVEYHEVKGWMDRKSKTKLKRMAKYYPATKLVLIDSKRYKQLAKTAQSVVPDWGAPATTRIEVSQEKVGSKAEERTEVVIERTNA